jgi:hypothetical protein
MLSVSAADLVIAFNCSPLLQAMTRQGEHSLKGWKHSITSLARILNDVVGQMTVSKKSQVPNSICTHSSGRCKWAECKYLRSPGET